MQNPESKALFKRAEELLSRIREVGAAIDAAQERHRRAVADLEAKAAAETAPLREEITGLDKDIKSLMSAHRQNIFAVSNVVKLRVGALIREIADKVRIPRDALARIEEHGWQEAIRIAKSVDRGVVEKWPDDKLAAIGAKRRAIEAFTYEVKK